MRVMVYCTGRSDKPVLKKFAEFAGFIGKREIPIWAGDKPSVFGVDDILKRLPEIAQALCGEFEKLIVVLDGSELRKSKKHTSRREWIARAADAVPRGMTICIVYMNAYLEEVVKASVVRHRLRKGTGTTGPVGGTLRGPPPSRRGSVHRGRPQRASPTDR